MKYLLILLLLTGCSTQSNVPRQHVSLPVFPITQTDYQYFIRLPIQTSAVSIYWYLESETSTNLLYSSGYTPVRTQTVNTDMYFRWPGKYILVYYCQTPDGVRQYKQTYNVRINPLYKGK